MAEHHQQYQYGHHPLHQQEHHTTDVIKSYLPDKTPSTSQVLAVATLFPVGGFLIGLAGIILTGTVIGLALATPLFVIFSPIILPAVLTIGFAVTGFLTSGAFGITALSAVSWLINYMRRNTGSFTEHFQHGAQRVGDTAGYMGQKAHDAVRS